MHNTMDVRALRQWGAPFCSVEGAEVAGNQLRRPLHESQSSDICKQQLMVMMVLILSYCPLLKCAMVKTCPNMLGWGMVILVLD